MKIEPLRKAQFKEYALLTPGHKSLFVETRHGKSEFNSSRDVTNALRKLRGFVCYVTNGLEYLKHTTTPTEWVLTTWRGKGVKMTHTPTGLTVTSLRSTLDESTDPFYDLDQCLTWLKGYGVPPASISSMAWKLLRASLSGMAPVSFDPELSRRAFFGGRQEIAKPGIKSDAKLYDLQAAYPSAMASRPVALSLRKVSNDTTIDPYLAGMAEVRVSVPTDMIHPPLPVRVGPNAIQFQTGTFEGVWTWVELDAAKQLGCDIEVLNNYAPGRSLDLFSNWWDMAQTGRSLSGGAAKLAKAIANSTWGQFAMQGDARAEVSWADEKGNQPFITELDQRPMPHVYALGLAAEITGRVRAQTLLEGVYGTGGTPEHIDTDGVIIPFNARAPKNVGPNFGQWKLKEQMATVQILAPQFYRYRRESEWFFADNGKRVEGPWHYVASGMSHDLAKRTFDRKPIESPIAYLSIQDVCLPSANADDRDYIDRLLLEAKRLGVA